MGFKIGRGGQFQSLGACLGDAKSSRAMASPPPQCRVLGLNLRQDEEYGQGPKASLVPGDAVGLVSKCGPESPGQAQGTNPTITIPALFTNENAKVWVG